MRTGPQPVRWALFSRKGRIHRATFALGVAPLFTVWSFCLSQVSALPDNSDEQQT